MGKTTNLQSSSLLERTEEKDWKRVELVLIICGYSLAFAVGLMSDLVPH